MDVLKRIVNLRDFTEKFGGTEPYIDFDEISGETSYGKIPYDINIDSDVLMEINIPLTEEGYLRYGNAARYYTWIRNFIMESKYYRALYPKGVFTWVETGGTLNFRDEPIGKIDLFAASCLVCSALPEEESYACNDIICLNENAEEFKEMFNDVDSAVDYIDLFENYILTGNYSAVTPFVDVTIALNSMANDLGSEEYLDIEAVENEEDYPEDEFYVESQLKTLLRTKTSVDENGNVLDFVESGGVNELRYVSGVPQSFLYDTERGCYTYNIISSITLNYETEKKGTIEFVYYVGCLLDAAENKENGIKYTEVYNFTVEISDFNNKEYIKIDYGSGFRPEWGEDNKQYAKITYDGFKSKIYSFQEVRIYMATTDHTQTWENEYWIPMGKTIDVKNKKYYMWLKYEQYRDTNSYQPADDDVPNKYILTLDSPENITEESDYYVLSVDNNQIFNYDDFYGDKVCYITEIRKKTVEQPPFIRRDTLIGTTEVKFNADNVIIDRGSSASYEAFNVLGEVNSITDIEKYHNDWYRIKGKND